MLSNLVKKVVNSSAFLAAALAVTVSTTPAHAVGIQIQAIGGPSQVEFPGFFMIQYKGINYVGTQTTVVCSNGITIPGRNIDTIRFWHSLSQAALLSGKTLTIYYDDCVVNGVTTHYLNDVVLVK
jgi:hypothetical protein